MASAVIHIVVENEINKKLKRKSNQLLIGSVASDISKIIDEIPMDKINLLLEQISIVIEHTKEKKNLYLI